MNSLRDLNNISNQIIAYADDRPATITFNDNLLPNISTYAGSTFTSQPISDITAIYSRNYDLTFAVNVSTMPGSTVTWANLTGVGTGNLSVSAANGVYTVAGIKSLTDWNLVRAPNITVGSNVAIGTTTYSSTIGYENVYTRGWTSNVTVVSKDQLTQVVSSTYYNNATNAVNTITAAPQVFDLASKDFVSNVYTVTVTANAVSTISNVVCTSTIGGTSTYNSTTGQLTLQGNVIQLNDQLNHINYQVTSGANGVYQWTYQLTNPLSNYTTTKTQLIKSIINSITNNANANRTFVTNTSDQAIFATQTPAILDTTTPADQYQIVLTTTAGYFGTANTSVTANLTISGNATSVNSQIANIKFYPVKDITGDQQFTFTQTKNGTQQFSLTNNLIGIVSSTPVAGSGSFVFANVGTTTATLTYAQRNYLRTKITVIGGGGSGATPQYQSVYSGAFGGGGGAGGQLQELDNVNLSTYGNLTITVGDSDQASNIVANTTTILSAAAGASGYWGGQGGGYTSSSGQPGGAGYYNIPGGGGGGRGLGSFGSNGSSSTTGKAAYPTAGAGGAGGLGVRSIVNSTALPSIYCAGGGGGAGAGGTAKYAVSGGAGGSSVAGAGAGWTGSTVSRATTPTTYGSGGGGGYYYTNNSGAPTAGKQGVVVITFY